MFFYRFVENELVQSDLGTPSRILAKLYSDEIGQCTDTKSQNKRQDSTSVWFSWRKANPNEGVVQIHFLKMLKANLRKNRNNPKDSVNCGGIFEFSHSFCDNVGACH